MSRHDIFQLIWESGLSTSDQTAQAAGRGTGMDIVRSKIADLSGTVDLDSEPGRGTTLVIRLPLTLAILPSLMVRIDGDVFAIPLESVAEIVSVAPSRILTVHGQPTARVRDRTISTISIGSLFTWNHPAGRRQAETASETTLVILDEKGQQLGLVVDHVLGEEDIVIKSIAENYRSIPGVTGASIRGDGRVSLILDPPAMFAMLSRGKAFSLNAQENAV
jgi:two-component system chemotaxis sensor kinase CheA